jgi:hypothetical protein
VATIRKRAWWSPRRIILAAAATLVVTMAATALALLLWVRSYSPLANATFRYPQPARGVRPLSLGGKEDVAAYLARPGLVKIGYGLFSDGRWPVDVEGFQLVPASGTMFPVDRVSVRDPRVLSYHRLPAREWKVRIGRDGAQTCRPAPSLLL